MPITPFHLGPGLALKSCSPRAFSLTAFVIAQVIIDLEPLYYLLRNDYPWHRFMHTLSGATLVTVLTILTTQPSRRLIERIRHALGNHRAQYPSVSWLAITLGATLGSYSHVALDAIMHNDVFPLAGFSQASPWHGAISLDTLEGICLALGIVGSVILSYRARKQI